VIPLYEGVVGWLEQLDDLAARGFAPSGLFPVTRDPGLRLVELDAVLVRAGVEGSTGAGSGGSRHLTRSQLTPL
jgi:hypothetical protein